MCDEQGPRGGPPEILYGSVVDYFASMMVAAGSADCMVSAARSSDTPTCWPRSRKADAESRPLRAVIEAVTSALAVRLRQRGLAGR